METDDTATALQRVSATGIYDAIEAIYIEAHDAMDTPLAPEKLEGFINELEAMAGAKPEQRTLNTADDSEVEIGRTATILAWVDKDDVHVKTIQELLGNPMTKSRTVGTWKCVTEPHGLTSMWTAATGEKVLVYAAGEGKRVVGWSTEEKDEEFESVGVTIEKAQADGQRKKIMYAVDKDGEVREVESVRQIGTKTFYRRQNVWYDAPIARQTPAEQLALRPERIAQFSKEYFHLVDTYGGEVAKYLGFEEAVILELGGRVYQIDPASGE